MLWRLEAARGAVHAYGGLIHDADAVALREGRYTLSLLLRHVDRQALAAVKDLPLLLHMPLAKPLECGVYGERAAASTAGHDAGETLKERWLKRGAHQDVYVQRPAEKLPAWVRPGDVLRGSLKLHEDQPDALAVPLTDEAPPACAAAPEDGDAPAPDGEARADPVAADAKALDEAVRDAKLQRLTALRSEGASHERYRALADVLLAEHSAHLPLLFENISFAQKGAVPASIATTEPAWRAAAVSAAVASLRAPAGPVDVEKLAQYFGCHHESETADEKKRAKEMDEHRAALRFALLAKAVALSDALAESDASSSSTASSEAFEEAIDELKRWVPGPDALKDEDERDRYALVIARYEVGRARAGAALETLRKRLSSQKPESKLARDLTDELVSLCRSLGFDHWATNAQEDCFRRFPVVRRPL